MSITSKNDIWKSSFMTRKNALCLIWLGMRGVRNDNTHTHNGITHKSQGILTTQFPARAVNLNHKPSPDECVHVCVYKSWSEPVHKFKFQVCKGFIYVFDTHRCPELKKLEKTCVCVCICTLNKKPTCLGKVTGCSAFSISECTKAKDWVSSVSSLHRH